MTELTLREIQLGELEVLKKFAKICEEQGFRYYLFYGTLLGVVRHSGFIPWDDDIDIVMPRPDYEKLLLYCAEHAEELKPLVMMHYTTNRDYIYAIARFCDTQYYVDYQGVKKYGLGLFIDIYPLDGWGNDDDDPSEILEAAKMDLCFIQLAGSSSFSKSKKGFLRTLLKCLALLYAKLMGARYFAKRLDMRAKKRKYEDDKYVGVTCWSTYGIKDRINKECLEFSEGGFEEHFFCIPKGVDIILKNIYGDYMCLPPQKDRVGHHYYRAFLK